MKQRLRKAYIQGVTDVICGITLAVMYAVIFAIWF